MAISDGKTASSRCYNGPLTIAVLLCEYKQIIEIEIILFS